MIDFIGDVHGHSEKLQALLIKLGYSCNNEIYSHPNRKVLFVGDYIDRGPQIPETLKIVRQMVECGNAIALMGNHEYNALCFHYQETEGGHLRKHLIKNIIQHYETLKQFHNRQEEYEEYIDWFKTLPLFYETDTFRAVHACWDIQSIKYLKNVLVNNKLNDDLIYQSVKEGSKLNVALEETLKGKEISIPHGFGFKDKDGAIRTEIRIKWWENPLTRNYSEISVEAMENLPAVPIDLSRAENMSFYHDTEKPVFFGHYWLKGDPILYRNNICCLDYSVAKEGYLVAYRFDGEQELQKDKLIFV